MIKHDIIDGIEVFSAQPATASDRPPLLFIHGAFAGAWMWTETFMPWLASAGSACHALSLRGHGGSAGHDEINWHSIADYVDDVAAVARRFDRPPVLIGHSMGGFVAQKYLEHHAAAGMALLCSVPPQGLVAAQFHLILSKPQLFAEINRIMGGQYTDTQTLREALFAGDVDKDLLESWIARMQGESHRALWDMSMFNLPNIYRMKQAPVFVMGAEHDALVPAFLVQSTAHTYGVPAHIMRGMGHAITHETDWRLAAGLLGDWLETLRP